MISSKDLYGCDPKEWKDMSFTDALKYRIEKLNIQNDKIVTIFNNLDFKKEEDRCIYNSLSNKQNKIIKAIKWNEFLLNELEEY